MQRNNKKAKHGNAHSNSLKALIAHVSANKPLGDLTINNAEPIELMFELGKDNEVDFLGINKTFSPKSVINYAKLFNFKEENQNEIFR